MKRLSLCNGLAGKLWGLARPALRLALFGCLSCLGPIVWAQSPVPIIDTVAGGGTSPGNGDGGPATQASLNNPVDVAIDASGNLYIAETYAFRVRKVTRTGIISTAAGNGTQMFNGDGIPATDAGMDVRGVAVDSSGNLYIADLVNRRVRKVMTSGIITTVAGNGGDGDSDDSGDGGPATAAGVWPSKVAISPSGELYIVDRVRIRKVGSDGIIRAVAGNGVYGFSGDGGPATSAKLANPEGIAFDRAGNLYIADIGNDRIRRVTTDGTITTVAGGGHFRSDPVARSMYLLGPHGVAVDSRGNMYITEANNLIRVVNADGIIQGVVGQFNDTTFGNEGAPWGFSGDGGPAIDAVIYEPMGIVLDEQENLYFVDNRNNRVRKVTTIPTPATPAGTDALGPHKIYPVGSFGQHVAVADVTGDGRDDALLTTTSWGGEEPENDMKLWLFVQKPDGTLAAPLKYGYFGDLGRSGRGLATADLNRDGFMDVILGTLRGITIYRGNATGLSSGTEIPSFTDAETVVSLVPMDVNGDGNLDIVTFGGGRSEGGTSPTDKHGITVFYGNGAGGISRKRFHPRQDEYGWKLLRATDVNGDGKADLTSAWDLIGSGGVELTLHDGYWGFLSTGRLMSAESDGWGAAYAMGDFNSDGRKDAIVSRRGNSPQAAYLYFQQTANGQFAEARQWRAYDSPDDMISTDMNGDGRDDLLVLHGGWSSVGYHQQTSDGLGVEVKYYTVQSGNPRSPAMAVGDLNRDGCKDVALADYNYGLVVLEGRNCIVAKPMSGSQPRIPSRPSVRAGPAASGSHMSLPPPRSKPEHHGAEYRSAKASAPPKTDAPHHQSRWFMSRQFALFLCFVAFALLSFGFTVRFRWM